MLRRLLDLLFGSGKPEPKQSVKGKVELHDRGVYVPERVKLVEPKLDYSPLEFETIPETIPATVIKPTKHRRSKRKPIDAIDVVVGDVRDMRKKLDVLAESNPLIREFLGTADEFVGMGWIGMLKRAVNSKELMGAKDISDEEKLLIKRYVGQLAKESRGSEIGE